MNRTHPELPIHALQELVKNRTGRILRDWVYGRGVPPTREQLIEYLELTGPLQLERFLNHPSIHTLPIAKEAAEFMKLYPWMENWDEYTWALFKATFA